MIDLNEVDESYFDSLFAESESLVSEDLWYYRIEVEAGDIVNLITRLREAERDAVRWRRMYDSALREAKQQYEWRMEDSECGGNEIMDGLHTLECMVIDQAMKEKGDE